MAYFRVHGAASPGTDFIVPTGGATVSLITGSATITIDGTSHTVVAGWSLEGKEVINVVGASSIVHLDSAS